jgi:hypothetical protein
LLTPSRTILVLTRHFAFAAAFVAEVSGVFEEDGVFAYVACS